MASDGENEDVLHGTTLRVYRYILGQAKPVRVREVQRALKFSSPRLASYHIEKLLTSGLVKDTGSGYVVDKVVLSNIVKIWRFVVPRYLFYSIFFTALLIAELTVLNPHVLFREYLLAVFATAVASGIFTFETASAWRKVKLR